MEAAGPQLHSVNDVTRVQFASSDQFHNRNFIHDGDIAFAQFQRKSWMRAKGDAHSNREALATLLSTHSDNSEECVEKLISENISYRDLASLTEADLELIGFKNSQERQELLALFAELPNQNPTLENICALPEAQKYNRDILNNTTQHLEHMRSALAAANYKLKIMPPEDIVVGEKHFASRFMLDALNELQNATKIMNKEFADLEEILAKRHKLLNQETVPKSKSRKLWLMYCTMAAFGALAALWFYKGNKAF